MKEYKFRISKISTWVAEKKTDTAYYIQFYRGKWRGWQFYIFGGGHTKDMALAATWKVLSEDQYKKLDDYTKSQADDGCHREGVTMKGMVEICRNIASDMGADRFVVEETEEVSF